MPLNARQISAGFSVICFFGIGIIGSVCKLSPFTCCKRAVLGTILVYIVTIYAVKAINMVLVDAMITKHISQKMHKQSQGTTGDDGKN